MIKLISIYFSLYNQQYLIFCSNLSAQSHFNHVVLCALSLLLSRFYAQFASHAEWNWNIALNLNVTLFIASRVSIQWPIESDRSVIATGALGVISFALYLIYIYILLLFVTSAADNALDGWVWIEWNCQPIATGDCVSTNVHEESTANLAKTCKQNVDMISAIKYR